MGRRRKTKADRRAERFGELYRVGKARFQLTEDQVGDILGMKRPALLSRRKDPGKFSIEEFSILGDMFGWTGEDVMSILRPEK